jgi:hypothetical protein
MEGFKFEYINEKSQTCKISLENQKIQEILVGMPVKKGVHELLKIFAIMKILSEGDARSETEAGEIILDLYDQLDVKIFEPEDIFTHSVIQQLLESKNISSLFVEINNGPVLIETGATLDSVMDYWKKSLHKKTEKEVSEDRIEMENAQGKVDELFMQLESLNFNDLEATMEWLISYNDNIQEYISDDHIEEVLKKFQQHGYTKENNDKIDIILGQTLKDKKKLGTAFIGYMLDNLGAFYSTQVDKWLSDWKKIT